MADLIERGSAVISACGRYRYRLERQVGAGPRVAAFIMVNPSTADGEVDDPTIRKLIGFSRRHFIGRFIVGNKFAYRATDVKALRSAPDPIGPENDRHLEQIMREADLAIVAWGPLNKLPPHLRSRWEDIADLAQRIGRTLQCLGTAKDGHPRHPLMLGYDSELTTWALKARSTSKEPG